MQGFEGGVWGIEYAKTSFWVSVRLRRWMDPCRVPVHSLAAFERCRWMGSDGFTVYEVLRTVNQMVGLFRRPASFSQSCQCSSIQIWMQKVECFNIFNVPVTTKTPRPKDSKDPTAPAIAVTAARSFCYDEWLLDSMLSVRFTALRQAERSKALLRLVRCRIFFFFFCFVRYICSLMTPTNVSFHSAAQQPCRC